MGHLTNVATQIIGDADKTVSRWRHDETGKVFMVREVGNYFAVTVQDQFDRWEDLGRMTLSQMVQLVQTDHHL
jgi:hypothetical protein